MNARARCPRWILALCLTATAVASAPGFAEAADPRRSREKMVELNKEALLSYDVKDWLTARDLLLKALQEARLAGLESNNMTARTYIHLGAVQWVGFRDRAAAQKSFSMAKEIRPDIKLTPAIDTSELRSLFAQATGTPEPEAATSSLPPPAPPPPAPPTPTPPPPRADPSAVASASAPAIDDGPDEPELPSTLSAPLMCTVPATIKPNTEFKFRCALEPGLNAQLVQLHYRIPGAQSYEALDMQRTFKGWYIVTFPASETKPGVLQVYFDARDESGTQLAANGETDSPSVIAIRERGESGTPSTDPDDPMAHIEELIRRERYEAGLHRRRAGAFWLGVGGGLGWGYVPSGALEWQQHIEISATATTTGLFHVLPEIGYMVTDNFALALQGRLEFIKQEQATYIHPDTKDRLTVTPKLSNAPATMAPAVFARAIGYTDITSGGNLRLSFSADLGAGYLRLPVKPKADVVVWDPNQLDYVPDYDYTIAKTDTRAVSIFLGGATVGFLWNLSRHFAVSLAGRVLTGFPNWGVVTEGGLSLEVAFGGVHGPQTKPDEGDDVVEREEPLEVTDEWDTAE